MYVSPLYIPPNRFSCSQSWTGFKLSNVARRFNYSARYLDPEPCSKDIWIHFWVSCLFIGTLIKVQGKLIDRATFWKVVHGFTKNRTVQLSLTNQFLGLVFGVVRLQYFFLCISSILSSVAIKKFPDESKYEGSFIHSWIKPGLPWEFHYKKIKIKKKGEKRKKI